LTWAPVVCQGFLVPRFPRWVLGILAALLLLHENYWLWKNVDLILGIPSNLLFHLGLCLVTSATLAWLMRGSGEDREEEE
jgi:hypothetical protein